MKTMLLIVYERNNDRITMRAFPATHRGKRDIERLEDHMGRSGHLDLAIFDVEDRQR